MPAAASLLSVLPEFLKLKTFVSLFLLPGLLYSISKDKRAPDTKSSFKDEYDFIVIGAGSAGATVAGRLSELDCITTLLLEAGGKPPLLNEVPALARNFFNTDLDWQFKTVPQKHTGNSLKDRKVAWPSGKGLGGSSLLNAMLFVRGNKKDYDDWAAQGAEGWSYDDVLPYFKKLEDNKNEDFLANGYHGTGGPVTVEKPRYDDSDLKRLILETAVGMGYRVGDVNGPNQTGFYDYQANIRNAQRCSTAKAYLVPAEKRSNLDVVAKAYVKKIIFENKKAVGVIFDFQGKERTVRVRKEVILSAGTTNSAQLLMLSGIGPKQHLEERNIEVIADLPVGDNFQDHCSCVMNYALPKGYPTAIDKLTDPKTIRDYTKNRTGILTSSEFVSSVAFLKGFDPKPDVDFPNYELTFGEGDSNLVHAQLGLTEKAYEQVYKPYEKKPFFICQAQLLHPKSRGSVRLNSDDPYDPPLIDPNYFEDTQDLEDVMQAMKMCDRITKSDPMTKFGVKPFDNVYPGCEKFNEDYDKALACHARAMVVTMSHQVGTAKMGNPDDSTTVVDPQLRVKGIEGLRVVDASVMPIVPSGNTNVPTIMVAEKGADLIKKNLNCNPK